MNELDFERLARHAAGSIRDEADGIADSRSALATLLATEPPIAAPATRLVELEPARPRRWGFGAPLLAAAAAVALVVGGIALLARDDDGSIVVTTEPPTVDESTTEVVAPNEPTVTTEPTATTVPETVPETTGDPVVIPDEIGPQLARTVLATVGDGAGPGELGIEECQECEPVRPFAPVVTDDGAVLVADAYNGRWQVFRDGTWTSVPYRAGETVIATPVVGPDGLLYAMVADELSGRTGVRVVAYDTASLEIVESYPGGNRMYPSVDSVGDSIVVGGGVVHTIDVPLGFPTWGIDRESREIDLALSGVAVSFRYPDRWEPYEGAALPDDGSVVLHVWALNEQETSDWFLLRLWPDGTWATGSIGTAPSTTNVDGRFSGTGWVQLEDAIVEYALPEFDGPDPLAGWATPDSAAPDLDTVPRLLPDLPAGTALFRREGASGATGRVAYDQTWARTVGDGAVDGLVQITTRFDPNLLGNSVLDVDVPGWPKAYFSATGDVTTLRLHSATRTVVVWTTGLTTGEVVALASSLTVDVDGTGWTTPDLPGNAWVAVAEGWATGSADRTLVRRNGDRTTMELTVSVGNPAAIMTPVGVGLDLAVVDIAGRPALLVDRGDIRAVTWSPSDGVVVVIGATETTAELLALARSVTEVDEATWDAASVPDTSTDDGCTSLFC